ncbi:hypothetical protein [Saccharopolyspora taberi]
MEEPAHTDPESIRLADLAALRGWAIRRDRMPADRARLLAAAWRSGTRNVRELARLADVSRDTVYADLKSHDIDPRDRTGRPGPPRYAPLSHEEVAELADLAAATLGKAMLAEEPGPVAEAAWQAQIALTRVGDLLDPQQSGERYGLADDLAYRGGRVRRHAHQLLAAEHDEAELARRTEQDMITMCDVQPVVFGAQLTLGLPNGDSVTVHLKSAGSKHRWPGWMTWRSDSPHLTGDVDGFAHLEITAALAALADAITPALEPEALEER